MEIDLNAIEKIAKSILDEGGLQKFIAQKNYLAPFRAFGAYIEETHRVLMLSTDGIKHMVGMTHLREVMDKTIPLVANTPGPPIERISLEEIEHSRIIEKMAIDEVASDFPLLHAHAVVSVWSALEALFPDFAARWLFKYPNTLNRPELGKIKVPLPLYHSMSTYEQMEYAVDQIFQAVQSGKKPGVGRFEAVLEALGLGGPVHDQVRRDLYEMSQVRNLIVHRFSIVDAKFTSACPWLKLRAGDRLKIGQEGYRRYTKAAREYSATVLERVHKIEKQLFAASQSA